MTVINVLLIFYKLTGICLLDMHVYSNASIKEFVDQKTQEVKLFIYQGCKSHIYSSYSFETSHFNSLLQVTPRFNSHPRRKMLKTGTILF